MEHHVCPWWCAYIFDNRLRRFFHKPEKIFSQYVKEGMTVMDVGCGMGFFSIGMARIVGKKGLVISVDLQQKMLDVLAKRAQKAGVANRIRTHRCEPDRIGIKSRVDFVLAFWMVHEVPDPAATLQEMHSSLNPGGKLLIAEPSFHVSGKDYQEIVRSAQDAGFVFLENLDIRLSRASAFVKELHQN